MKKTITLISIMILILNILNAQVVLPGLQINKRSYNQGWSVGANILLALPTELKLRNGKHEYAQIFILNINHHINNKELRPINSQSIELQIYPSISKKYNQVLLGGGIELRHFDFQNVLVSPKLILMIPGAAVYIQKNKLIKENRNTPISNYTIGLELNTSFLLGAYIRSEP